MKETIISLKKALEEIAVELTKPKSIKFYYKNIRVERLSRAGVQYRIILGFLSLIAWICIFNMGLTINSSIYRAAIAFGYADWQDFILTIFTFTPTNVGILAAFAGLIGGISSNLSANNFLKRTWLQEFNGFSQDKSITSNDTSKSNESQTKNDTIISVEERRMIYLTERPMVSMIRGFMVYLIFVAGSYITSFNDINADGLNGNPTTDSTFLKTNELKIKSIITKTDTILLLKQAIEVQKQVVETQNQSDKKKYDSLQIRKAEYRRSLDRNPYIPFKDNIPGLSIGSYFKFAVTVSLLAFMVGYDPSRFEGLLNRFGSKDI